MRQTTRRDVLKGVVASSTVGLTGLAGCTGGGGGGGTETAGGTTQGKTTGKAGGGGPTSFTVGVFSAFSGPFADWGPAHKLGATIAAEDVKKDHDVEVTIKQYDTETDPSAALDRMKRAVTADGIDFAFGGISSAVCSSMGTWASDNGVVYVADGSSGTLTGKDCKPYMFRTYSSNPMMSNAVAPHMADLADSWYLLYADYVWGQNAQGIIGDLLGKEGATVVGSDATPWPPTSNDYTQYLNNVANSDAAGLALIEPGGLPAGMMKQARNMGILGDYKVMVHQAEDPTFWGVGKWAAEAVDIAPVGWNNAVPGGEAFKKEVASRGNLDPFVRHVTAYEGMDSLLRAAIRAGSKDAADVRGALEGYQITGSRINDLEDGKVYWRACDHQLVKPTYIISGRAQADMQDTPYKSWFSIDQTLAGDDVARSCADTGCSF